MTEQWIKWEPIPGLFPHYRIDKISNTLKELSIILSQGNNPDIKLKVTFKESIEAYRNTYETFRLKISCQYEAQSFYKVEGSEYLQWLSEQAKLSNLDNDMKFTHFAITTDDTILDIIAKHDPQVEFVHK